VDLGGPCASRRPDQRYKYRAVHVSTGIPWLVFLTNALASVSPIYYVTFTSAVFTPSFIIFQGFDVTDEVKSMSLLGGFFTIFTGVYLLTSTAAI
jgi:hypothetical protein